MLLLPPSNIFGSALQPLYVLGVGQGVQRAAAPLLWCVAAVQQRGEPAPCAAQKEKTCSGGERGREAEIMQISVCAGRWGNAGDEGSGALQGYARVGAKGLIPSPGWAGIGAPLHRSGRAVRDPVLCPAPWVGKCTRVASVRG